MLNTAFVFHSATAETLADKISEVMSFALALILLADPG